MSFKTRLTAGEVVYGPFVRIPYPGIMEILGYSGFDFAIIDSEHSTINFSQAEDMVRGAQVGGITPIMRVNDNDPSLILKALDLGAKGAQIPQVTTKDEAEAAVEATYYTPQGNRGLCCGVRAAEFSHMDSNQYVKGANQENLSILHIEGREGIGNLDKILTVSDIDVIFLGPYDLSQSLGVPGQIDHPDVIKTMEEAIAKSNNQNTIVGTYADDIKAAQKWVDLGVKYMSVSLDTVLLYEGAKSLASKLKS